MKVLLKFLLKLLGIKNNFDSYKKEKINHSESYETIVEVSEGQLEKLLIENGFITEKQLSIAQEQVTGSSLPITDILIGMGFITDKDLTKILGLQLNVDFVDLDNMELNPDIVKTIPENLAKRYNVIAVDIVDNRIRLAMANPRDILAIDDIRLVTGYDIEPVIANESSLKKVIGTQFGSSDLC